MLSRQQYLRYAAQQPSPAPAPRPARKLSRTQHVLACVLWVCCIPLLLLAFLMLGERPTLKS